MEQKEKIRLLKRYIELAVLISIILIYGLATYKRNFVWSDDISLWSDTSKKSPLKARPHNNLAFAYTEKDIFDKAITEATTALNLRPDYPGPLVSLGNVYFKMGLFDMAIISYKNAISMNPEYFEPYYGLGITYAKKNDMALAIESFKKAVELRPNDITSHINLSAAYGASGLTEKAIAELHHSLGIKPDSPDIYFNLGVAYEELAKSKVQNDNKGIEQKRLFQQAVEHYKEVLRINPEDKEAGERIRRLRTRGY